MPEQNTKSVTGGNWSEQRRNKPSIEDVISEIITDNGMKQAALDFVAHLRKNSWGIVWTVANEWWVTLYCQPVCKINIKSENWNHDERLNKYSWLVSFRFDNIRIRECEKTNGNLDLYNSIYEKQIFNDPDKNDLENLKQFLELDKKAKNSKQANISIFKYKAATQSKDQIEDFIPVYITGDMRKTALDFVAYLKESKMKPSWSVTNTWNANCKGKSLCKINLGEEVWANSKSWSIQLRLNHLGEYEDAIINDGLQDIVWNGIKYCSSCTGCAPGRDVTLFGKECKGLCHAPNVTVCDPDETTVNGIKRLLELEKQARIEKAIAK